jgi:hypothetical protein
MRSFLITCLLAIFSIIPGKAVAQGKDIRYGYEAITMPAGKALRNWFLINDQGSLFVSHEGGIYVLKDSSWFIPPVSNLVFTSYAPVPKDTAIFVVANNEKFSEIYYVKSSTSSAIQKLLLCQLRRGIYNLIVKDQICYVWGYSNGRSKLGIVSGNEVKWLLDVQGIIRQVQVNNASQIHFALGNAVYRLNDTKALLRLDKPINGFCFDKMNNLIASSEQRVGIQKGDQFVIIANGIGGPLQYHDEDIFVLSNAMQQIVRIFPEKRK